jgi:hypothetical protein
MSEQNSNEVQEAPEVMNEEERSRIEEILNDLPKGVLGPIDLLADGLALLLGDRIAMALRNKEQVENIIYQLSIVTKTITTLASMLDMQLGNVTVTPSDDFNEWNARRLKLLASMMISYIEQNTRERDNANEAAAAALVKLNAHIASTATVESKSNEIVSIAEGKIEALSEQVKTLNGILASFHEQECFIVARIDYVTKKPIKFYINGDEIRQSKRMEQATRLTKVQARDFRSEVIRSLFARANKLDALHLHDEIIIMQVSLSYVPVIDEDLDE